MKRYLVFNDGDFTGGTDVARSKNPRKTHRVLSLIYCQARRFVRKSFYDGRMRNAYFSQPWRHGCNNDGYLKKMAGFDRKCIKMDLFRSNRKLKISRWTLRCYFRRRIEKNMPWVLWQSGKNVKDVKKRLAVVESPIDKNNPNYTHSFRYS